jgi:hypothetical protein
MAPALALDHEGAPPAANGDELRAHGEIELVLCRLRHRPYLRYPKLRAYWYRILQKGWPQPCVHVVSSADSVRRMKFGLFERLSVPVESFDAESTMETREDADTFDDDPGLLGLQIPETVLVQTRNTFADADTFDDDAGPPVLGAPWTAYRETRFTEADSDTFDDDSEIGLLSVPRTLTETSFSKEDGETLDDDPGIDGLSFPVVLVQDERADSPSGHP